MPHSRTKQVRRSHDPPHGIFIDLMARLAALYFGR